MTKLIQTITNICGDTYKLYQTGTSFKTVVHYVARSNKRGSIPAETIERKHKSLSNAEGSKLKGMFKGVMIA